MSAPAGIGWGIGPQVNKFEQVFNDNHQMSVAGGGCPSHCGEGVGLGGQGGRCPGLMSTGRGR